MKAIQGFARPRIEGLNGPNYRLWSIQVKDLLMGLKLWEVVELGVQKSASEAGDESASKAEGEPAPKEPEPNYRDVYAASRANTIIMDYCSASYKQFIMDIGTSQERWKTLKELCTLTRT